MHHFDGHTGQSAFDFALFFTRSLVAARASKGPKVISAKEAETRALLFALNAIKDCRFSRVRVHMDALKVVKSIKGSKYWSIQSLVGDILKCLKHYESFETFFIPRDLNRVAHYLAKCGRSGINFIWPYCE
eukprot:TRINITY_DN9206_c0_g1_i1.p1 TRINITY_DN9206_c0_g1~~TRINITY_DN9206_c0_g1_i1.p1  ORF type:complete len:131 (+),score=6.51 TRINITY_DN9206_c0_g1_i1:83-475(+)